MAQTYRFSTATSNITVASSTTHSLVTGTGVGTETIQAPSGPSNLSYYYTTPTGNPGTGGATGNYTIVLNVSSSTNNTQARVNVHRVNSSGAIQNSATISAYQSTATTGDKTYTFTSQSLGTWAAGDRLAVQVDVQNQSAHGGASGPTFDFTATNTRVDTPFTVSQQFQQTVGPATLSFTGSRPVLAVGHGLAGSLGFSGSIAKGIRASLAGALSFAGNLGTSFQTALALTASLDFTGSMSGRLTTFHQALTAALGFVTAMVPVKSGTGQASLTARHIHPAD